MNELQEADLLRALETVEQAWSDWNSHSDADRVKHLEGLNAIAEGISDYSGFAESTQLGQGKQLWLN